MATLLATQQLDESLQAPRELEVPAPTAWPFVLAFGSTLLFAGLVTVRVASASSAPCSPWPVASAGSAKSSLTSMKYRAGCCGRSSRNDRAPRGRAASGRGRSVARLASRPHLSDLGRCEGRIGRQRSDGRASLCLRRAEGRKHLVSHQSSGGVGLRAIAETRPGTAEFVSCGQLFRLPWVCTLLVSTLVGLLYGAMLPMFPRRPIVLGGLIAPSACGRGCCTRCWAC